MEDLSGKISIEEIIYMVDACGELSFDNWYKNTLTYKNDSYTVCIIPDYRDTCEAVETLTSLLYCEDYTCVSVFKGTEKPFEWEYSKEGDNR